MIYVCQVPTCLLTQKEEKRKKKKKTQYFYLNLGNKSSWWFYSLIVSSVDLSLSVREGYFLNAELLLDYLLQIFSKYFSVYLTFSAEVNIPMNMKIYVGNGFFDCKWVKTRISVAP